MSITLYDPIGVVTVILPNDLEWVDEFDWSPLAQQTSYTITGALLIEESLKLAGRPISLEGKPDMGWVTRSVVLALQALRNIPNRNYTLTLADARSFSVKFNQDSVALVAKPVLPWKQQDVADWYTLNLRFIEV